MPEETTVEIGQEWRAKRDRHRRVKITFVYETGALGVRRNTSRRTQSISRKTLLRDYEPVPS